MGVALIGYAYSNAACVAREEPMPHDCHIFTSKGCDYCRNLKELKALKAYVETFEKAYTKYSSFGYEADELYNAAAYYAMASANRVRQGLPA
jgi:hypothetical protein